MLELAEERDIASKQTLCVIQVWANVWCCLQFTTGVLPYIRRTVGLRGKEAPWYPTQPCSGCRLPGSCRPLE